MDEEFERGKKRLVEGLTGFLELFKPYLLVHEGMKLLGLSGIREGFIDDDDPLVSADIWQLALSNFVGELNRAKDREEVQKAVDNHRDFIKRLF